MTLRDRVNEWRVGLYLNMWWPPKMLAAKIGGRVGKCDGCGRRFRTKHYSFGVWVIDGPSPPVEHYCDFACRRVEEDPTELQEVEA